LKVFKVSSIIIYCFICFLFFDQEKARNLNKLFIISYQSNKLEEAKSIIREAILTNSDNALFYSYLGLVRHRILEDKYMIAPFEKFPTASEHVLDSAIESYKQSLLLSPHDDRSYCNIAWLFFYKDEMDSALFYI